MNNAPDKIPSPAPQKDKLRLDSLSDEQIQTLTENWKSVQDSDSETPMADLRSALTESGLFDFASKYEMNNLELKELANEASKPPEEQGGEETEESAREEELNAILDAVKDKSTYADKRTALSDLLGFRKIFEMNNLDIDKFIADAEAELKTAEPAERAEEAPADDVRDLDAYQLRYEMHHHDDEQLAEGRDTEAKQIVVEDGNEADDTRDLEAYQRRFESHTHADEQPVEGRDEPEQVPVQPAAPEEALDGDAIDPEAYEQRFESHTHDDEQPVEGGENTGKVSDEHASEVRPIPELKVSFVDQSHDAVTAARDAAEARRRDELNSGGRVKRFMKRFWKGETGAAGAFYFERYKKEALERIQHENDTLAYETNDKAVRARAQMATIERLQSEYDESVHTEAGERHEEIEADSQFAVAMKELIQRYASGEIENPEALAAERGRILDELGSDTLVGEGKVRIDNMLAIAEQVKAMVDHGESLERVMEGMKIYTGESRSGVRTETQMTKAEKLIERAQTSKVGRFVSPEVAGAAAAIGLGVTRAGRGSMLAAMGVTVAPGVLSGAVAGAREYGRVKQERTIHSREMAQGKGFNSEDRRRSQMEEARYQTITALEATAGLEVLLPDDEERTPESVQAAFEQVAQIEARVRLSDQRNIDLVSYSDVATVEAERRDLDIARARAKVKLALHMGEMPAEYRENLKIEDGHTVDEALLRYTEAMTEIDQDMSEKDKVFRRLRRRRTLAAAGQGAATGALLGVAGQEAFALISSDYNGAFEGQSAGSRNTVLGEILHGRDASVSTSFESYDIGAHKDALELPTGYSIVENENGSFGLSSANGEMAVDGVRFDAEGRLTPESAALLDRQNISVIDTGHFETRATTVTKPVSTEQFVKLHEGEMSHVTRDFWYDNDTPKPVFDKNELKFHLGGEDGTGVTKDGDYAFSIARMEADGSYHNGQTADWESGIKMAVSASKDTQNDVFFIDFNSKGEAIIPKDSPVAELVSVEDGKLVAKGGYVEVVEVRETTGGETHVIPLATHVGENSLDTINAAVPTQEQVYVPYVKLVAEHPGTTVEGFGAPGTAVRRPLESLMTRRESGPRSPYAYAPKDSSYAQERSRETAQERRAEIEHEFSEKLRQNPDAKLSMGEEVLDYERRMLQTPEGTEKARAIKEFIDRTPELRDMSSDVDFIMTVPAASVYEQENIYNTLSLFAQQEGDALEHSVVIVNANRLDNAHDDPEKLAATQKTFAEIERAKRDFPGMKVAVMESIYNKEDIDRIGGALVVASSDLVDTALLTLAEKVKNGERDPEAEALIMRSDADVEGMSRNHFARLRKAMHSKQSDAFKGITRFGTNEQINLPGFGIATDIENISVAGRVRRGEVHLGGANFGVKASTMAAIGGYGEITYGGVGADDLMLGERLWLARTDSGELAQAGYYGAAGVGGGRKKDILTYVAGAGIDTNADRFVSRYRGGDYWQDVWSNDGREGSYASGEGGYAARDSASTGSSKRERFGRRDRVDFRRLEVNISGQMSVETPEDQRRILSRVFYNAPGAYKLTHDKNGMPQVRFTREGRDYVRKQTQAKRRQQSYGERKKLMLYGDKRGMTKLGRQADYVRPLGGKWKKS